MPDRTAGLSVRDCLEAPMEADFTRGAFAGATEAFWEGIPAALAWSLEKEG